MLQNCLLDLAHEQHMDLLQTPGELHMELWILLLELPECRQCRVDGDLRR